MLNFPNLGGSVRCTFLQRLQTHLRTLQSSFSRCLCAWLLKHQGTLLDSWFAAARKVYNVPCEPCEPCKVDSANVFAQGCWSIRVRYRNSGSLQLAKFTNVLAKLAKFAPEVYKLLCELCETWDPCGSICRVDCFLPKLVEQSQMRIQVPKFFFNLK